MDVDGGDEINVMLAGAGSMGRLIARNILSQPNMVLCETVLEAQNGSSVIKYRHEDVCLRHIGVDGHEQAILEDNPDIIVDFTQSNAAQTNAGLYSLLGVPFVMGTTGVDRQKLERSILKSGISAVVAPNMAIPIVIFQEMMKHVASMFPGSLRGWYLEIIESHQSGKQDISGTARAVAQNLRDLGLIFDDSRIVMIRDTQIQTSLLGIPIESLSGHGYHTYRLRSPDGSVDMVFTHNVRGRQAYADGTIRAINFLAKQRGLAGKVYTMADVLCESVV